MNERERMLAEGPRVASETQSAKAAFGSPVVQRNVPFWKRSYESWRPQLLSFGPFFLQLVLWPSAPGWVSAALLLLAFAHLAFDRFRRRRHST
jgi:hypothetical protein